MKKRVIQAVMCMLFALILLYRADYASRDFLLEKLQKATAETQGGITVCVYELTEENFYTFLNQQIEEILLENTDETVFCGIDGETNLAGFARVELKSGKHYVYLGEENRVYELSGEIESEEWNNSIKQIVSSVNSEPKGKEISDAIFAYEEKYSLNGGLTTRFYYDFFECTVWWNEKIVAYQKTKNGFALQLQRDVEGDSKIETIELGVVDDFPEYETEEEMRDYFLVLHPNADSYEVYLPEEDAKDMGNIYRIKEDENNYAYYKKMGQSYRIQSRGDNTYSFISEIQDAMWENYDSVAAWKKSEYGVKWRNSSAELISLEWETEDNIKLRVECKPVLSDETEQPGWNRMEVSVFRNGETQVFQVFKTGEYFSKSNRPNAYFADINMDGYVDIEVSRYDFSRYSYVDDFIWSPTRQEFVAEWDDIEFYTDREWDEEHRKVHVYYYYGSKNSETYTYQWENEMDLRLLSCMETADCGEKAMSFKIVSYEEGGSERTILDYVTEEPWELEDFATSLCYENILCEKVIQDKCTNMQYQLYYTQEKAADGEGDYEECLYVIDENLQPVNLLKWTGQCVYEEMRWNDEEYGRGKLEILYEDGSNKVCTLEELAGDKLIWQEWGVKEVVDIGTDISLCIEVVPMGDIHLSERPEKVQVSAFLEEEAIPFQIWEENVEDFYGSLKLYFCDYNSDGYSDLQLEFDISPHYAAEEVYIWSPSTEKFVKCPEELRNAWMWYPKGRRIMTWQETSGTGQEAWYYQWENETDYWLFMWYQYDCMYEDNRVSYVMKVYDKEGKETCLLDCVVEIDSWEDDFVESLIDIAMDILFQQTIQDEQTKELYYVYLVRTQSGFEETGKDCLYVINEALYPVGVHTIDAAGDCIEMEWITDEDGVGKLQILYEDGNSTEFTIEMLTEKKSCER